MWTGSASLRRAIAGLALLSLACRPQADSRAGEDTPTSAWWTTVSFTPSATTVRGIDVRSIDPQWRRATALDTAELRGRVARSDARQFATSPMSFSLTADLDRDGIAEEFFVGVFETADGRKGRFVAVTRGGRPVRHFAEEGGTGFSALLRGDGEVRWYKCMECGEFEAIKWTGSSYVLE